MAFEGGSQQTLRRYLLGTASGAALIGGAPFAQADTPIDHMYFDFSGQYSLQGGHTEWAPPQIAFGGGLNEPRIKVKNGIDTNLDVALQSGNWYLTLSANYGRTENSRDAFNYKKYRPNFFSQYRHSRGEALHHESHTIVDFTLGKDFGLGCLGLEGMNLLSAGVRYEHFVARTNTSISYSGHGYTKLGSPTGGFYDFYARQIDRQFVGWGPVITWKGRTAFDPDWSLSWGVNAALAIGNRSVEVDGASVLSKSTVSPQVGGYMGLTWQMPDSPLDFTVGYRGNAYFNIIDSAFGFEKHSDRIIHGPFAQVGVKVF